MSRRLVDNKNIKKIINRTKEFTLRAHGITILRIVYGLSGILALLILSMQALTGIIHADINKATLDNLAFSIIFIAGALLLLTGFFMCLIWKLQKIVTVAEFQNMLFSSVIRDKYDYCIVLTEEKEIIYMDKGAQKFFDADTAEKYKNFSLEKILNTDDQEILTNFLQAIKDKTSFKLSHYTQGHQFSALLEPINLTQGFLLLRAHIQH